jgi:hypothetical protein
MTLNTINYYHIELQMSAALLATRIRAEKLMWYQDLESCMLPSLKKHLHVLVQQSAQKHPTWNPVLLIAVKC